ncbi:MAG: hypothetical protein HEEMFOPI_02046 [Holosporales bacterium]
MHPLSKNLGKSISSQKKQWIPTYPVNVPYPDLRKEKQLGYMLKGRHEVAHFEYKDADGKTLGYVVRLEDKEGNKITPTLTYCQNNKGEKSWQFKGFGDDRPLYGLDVLKQKESAPVLIVEGEKTCDHARRIFKDHAVITWSGGCGSVQKSDWSVLKDRDVTIWPDHDKAGTLAASKIAAILNEKDVQSVSIIDLPSTLSHKWDLADNLPQRVTHKELMSNAIKIEVKEQGKEVPLQKTYAEEKERISHTIAYLTKEVESAQNDWMEKDKAETFLKIIKERPLESLNAWQSKMNDYSFKPLTNNEFSIYKENLSNILTEKAVSFETFTDLEKINPYNITRILNTVYSSLKIMDVESGMTSEKAFKILNDQRKNHIIAYIKEEIGFDKNQISEDDKIKGFIRNLEEKPFEILKIYQDHTKDYSFKPLTTVEIEKLQDKTAEKMIEKNLSKENLASIVSYTNSHHIENILKAVESSSFKKYKSQRSIDIQQTKNFVKQYEMSHNDSERQNTLSSKIENISKNYKNDDQFNKIQKDLQNNMNKQLER